MTLRERPISGVALIDKPSGLTSHDVVARVRRLAHTRRVGHAGTLDPMATGLLVLGIEKATRLLTFLVAADKEYEATIRFGQATITDDADGEVTFSVRAAHLSTTDIADALRTQTGDIWQVPSAVSAIKVAGRRSYARVRAGEDVQLAARPVHIARIETLATRISGDIVDVDVAVTCSSGTYIRAIARDAGNLLAVGAHLVALRRTRVGPFGIDDATPLAALGECPPLTAMADAASAVMKVRELSLQEVDELRYGRRIAGECGGSKQLPVAGIRQGELVALLADADGYSRPFVVM